MMERFKLFLRFTFLLIGVVYLAEAQAAYNVLDRFQLLEDKFRTQEMLREFNSKNFIIDIHALANTDVTDFIGDANDVADFQGTDQEKLDRAQAFLRQYENTEQNLRAGFGLNIPVFGFEVAGIKFKPNIRAQVNLGFLMGIQSSNLTPSDAIQYLGSDIPDQIRAKLNNCVSSFSPGSTRVSRDIVKFMIDTAACGLTAQEKTAMQSYVGEYIFPEDTSVPDIRNYIKGEARVGLSFDYTYDKNWFGNFSIYGLARADYTVRVSADNLTGDGDVAELPDELNTTINASVDYRLGYKQDNWMVFGSIEDLKLARVSDNEEEGGTLIYGEDPLLRLHGEYMMKLSGLSLKPFGGVHKRSSYGLGDGLYVGADLGAHVWEDSLGLRLRGMVDSEHLTISPMANLWLMHIEYMLKQPLTSDVDGIKPATIHSLNIRIDI